MSLLFSDFLFRQQNLNSYSHRNLFFGHKNLSTHEYNNYTGEGILKENNSSCLDRDVEVLHVISDESKSFLLFLILYEYIPNIVAVLLFGFISDSIGKRTFLMYFPSLGSVFYSIGFILPAYFGGNIDNIFTKTSLIVATLIAGFSGGISGFNSGYSCYVSDNETEDRQTIRLAILELIIGVTFGVGTFMNGFWLKVDNSQQPFWLILAVSLLSFLITIFFIDETKKVKVISKKNFVEQISNFKYIFTLKDSQKLWLFIIAFESFVLVHTSQDKLFFIFFKGPPFFWNSFEIGTFFLLLFGLCGLMSWPGILVLQKLFDDSSIFFISVVFKVIGSIVLAFSFNYLGVFAGRKIFHSYFFMITFVL